jgi:hypothetical protein
MNNRQARKACAFFRFRVVLLLMVPSVAHAEEAKGWIEGSVLNEEAGFGIEE